VAVTEGNGKGGPPGDDDRDDGGDSGDREDRGKGLTRETLEALLAALGPNRETAALQYEQIRRKLMRLFEWRGCTFPDELTDETFNRVARRLAEKVELRSADPYGYFCGVAHLVYKEVMRRQAREIAALESGDWPPPPAEEPVADRRLEILSHCLQTLDTDQRRLVLDYHRDENHICTRKDLSRELGVPMNALRIRVHRLRRKLEECIAEKLRT
jgi:DNA-directed RNA polymerase specialized sigma24 family protein